MKRSKKNNLNKKCKRKTTQIGTRASATIVKIKQGLKRPLEVTAGPGDITCRKSDDNCDAKTKYNVALHLHMPSGSSQQVLPLDRRKSALKRSRKKNTRVFKPVQSLLKNDNFRI